jgi:hypothetical protein
MVPLFPRDYRPDSTCTHGPIPFRSKFYCVVCDRCGMDGHPALHRDPRYEPRPEPKPVPVEPPKETRKQRRKRLAEEGNLLRAADRRLAAWRAELAEAAGRRAARSRAVGAADADLERMIS